VAIFVLIMCVLLRKPLVFSVSWLNYQVRSKSGSQNFFWITFNASAFISHSMHDDMNAGPARSICCSYTVAEYYWTWKVRIQIHAKNQKAALLISETRGLGSCAKSCSISATKKGRENQTPTRVLVARQTLDCARKAALYLPGFLLRIMWYSQSGNH
jgi:hypothetical protein